MKKILVLLLAVFVIIGWITYAQSNWKLTTNALAKQIATSLFSAYMEIEYAKVWGKDNYEFVNEIYQSDQFKVTQKDTLQQTLQQYKWEKKSLILPKIDKSTSTKELISTVKFEFIKKIHQLEASKVWWMDNYQMVLWIYASQKFKKEQKESLIQATQQFDWSNEWWDTIISNTNPEISNDWFTRWILTKEQLNSVLSGVIFTGKINSTIVLIEYSDVECPFCQRQFSSKTVDTVIEQNNIKATFKNFPLSFHSTAQKAAEAISCAANQWKLIEFKDALFGATTESSDKKPTIEIISATVRKLKLDKKSFDACLNDWKTTRQVQSEMNEWGAIFGVTWTPGNVLLNTITGKYVLVSGAYPAENFDPVVAELNK
jgi:protein-disulfide isomerase